MLFRYLTPYGKVMIIKSLVLSKLGHVALVIPTKQMLKHIEFFFSDSYGIISLK